MNAILIWIVKALASYVVNLAVKRLGHTEAATHIEQELENAKPLAPDPNPSPASLRNPNRYNG